MVVGIYLAILGIMFYFLKNLYQKIILKKSNDEILLDELLQEYSDSLSKFHFLKSKEKVEKEQNNLRNKIIELENKIKKNNTDK